VERRLRTASGGAIRSGRRWPPPRSGPRRPPLEQTRSNGSRIARNPDRPARGVATVGRPFVLGATAFDLRYGQGFYGWGGGLRITGRALAPAAFLSAPPASPCTCPVDRAAPADHPILSRRRAATGSPGRAGH